MRVEAGLMGTIRFHPIFTEVFLDEIFDAAAPLEDAHEELLVVRGSGVQWGWVDGHQD